MNRRSTVVTLVFLLVLAACGRDAPSPELGYVQHPPPVEAAASRTPGSAIPAATAPEAPVPRKLVRTASLEIEVEDYASASTRVETIARDAGGYVSGANVVRGERGGASGKLSLRVPAERLDAVLDGLREVGTVRAERVATDDVGKAYADLETRIAVKRETADRLRKILESRTGKLSDVLEVERELSRVVGEIEHMEGERRFYDRQVALSTVEVELHEPGAASGPGVLDPLREAFASALRTLVRSLAFLVSAVSALLPWLVVAGLILWLSLRRRLRRAA